MALVNNRTHVDDSGSGIALRKEVNGPVTTYSTWAKLDAKPSIGGSVYPSSVSVDPNTLAKYNVTYSTIDTGKSGGGGSSSGGANSASYSYGGGGFDPSELYAQMLAERNALMQKNYQAALDQLRGAYESNVNSLKNQGADAMREAYINMMMNKRGLNNSLASAGINGGATESVMANLFNTYANDRNKIARALNENLEEAGRTYGENVANLGINYNNNYSDVLNDYYTQLASAKMSLANQLSPITSRTSSGTSTSNSGSKKSDTDVITTTLKGFVKNPVSARNYLNSIGITGDAADQYLWSAGIDPSTTYASETSGLNQDILNILKSFQKSPSSAKSYLSSRGIIGDEANEYLWNAGIDPNPINEVDSNVREAVLSSLASVAAAARSNNNPNVMDMIENRMRQLANQYGLTEEQARALLAAAGY